MSAESNSPLANAADAEQIGVMGRLAQLLPSFRRFLRYAFLGIGGLAAVLGFIADASGGATFWSLNGAIWFNLGLLLTAIYLAWSTIRHDYLLNEFDKMWGNEHARKLLAQGIFPSRDYYFRYLRKGDYPTVVLFWAAGQVNVSDEGRTDLFVAAESGHAAIVRGIIERGGDPKQPDKSGRTPLMAAASLRHIAAAEALTQHDCAIGAKAASDGVSALYAASANGHLAMVDLLVRSGAPLDAVDHDNITPIMAAMVQQNWEVVRFLIKSGADLRRVDASGATLRDYAGMTKSTPQDIKDGIVAAGVEFSQPRIATGGSGHSGTGKVTVKWLPASEVEEEP